MTHTTRTIRTLVIALGAQPRECSSLIVRFTSSDVDCAQVDSSSDPDFRHAL
jgi:hypothetical protein